MLKVSSSLFIVCIPLTMLHASLILFYAMDIIGCYDGLLSFDNLLMIDFIHKTKISWAGDIRAVTTVETFIAVAPTHVTAPMARAIRDTILYTKIPHVINGDLEESK